MLQDIFLTTRQYLMPVKTLFDVCLSWKTNWLMNIVIDYPMRYDETTLRLGLCTWDFPSLPVCNVPLILAEQVYTVSATLVLDSSMFLRVWIDCLLLFRFPLYLLPFSLFLLPRSLSFAGKMRQEGCSTSHAAGRRLGVSSPSWNASAQLVKLCTPQCAWLLKRLAFAEVGELTSS